MLLRRTALGSLRWQDCGLQSGPRSRLHSRLVGRGPLARVLLVLRAIVPSYHYADFGSSPAQHQAPAAQVEVSTAGGDQMYLCVMDHERVVSVHCWAAKVMSQAKSLGRAETETAANPPMHRQVAKVATHLVIREERVKC